MSIIQWARNGGVGDIGTVGNIPDQLPPLSGALLDALTYRNAMDLASDSYNPAQDVLPESAPDTCIVTQQQQPGLRCMDDGQWHDIDNLYGGAYDARTPFQLAQSFNSKMIPPATSAGFFPDRDPDPASADQRWKTQKLPGGMTAIVNPNGSIELAKDRPVPITDMFSDPIQAAIDAQDAGAKANKAFPPTRLGSFLGQAFGPHVAYGYNAISNLLNTSSDALQAGGDLQAKFALGKAEFNCSARQDTCGASIDIAGVKRELSVEKRNGVWGFGVLGEDKSQAEFIPLPAAEKFKDIIGPMEKPKVVNDQISGFWNDGKQQTVDALRSLDKAMGEKAANQIFDGLTKNVPQFFKTGDAQVSTKLGPVTLTASANLGNAIQNVLPAIAAEFYKAVIYNAHDTINGLRGSGSPR